ncbi:MAG: MFS transporter [Acidimicrobiales bacterium]|nr:MFS transporter [Acidimicrobiales bacterium]
MSRPITEPPPAALEVREAVLRRRGLGGSYWRVWTASLISNIGDGVLLAALPILAARSTSSATLVGLVATFATLPWFLVTLPAGAIVDRLDRRRVLVVTDLFRAALLALIAVAVAGTDVPIGVLWALALGLGIGEVFFDLSSQAILPTIVSQRRFDRANGLRYAAEIGGNTFVGPPLGAALFAVAAWLPFAVDAATFVAAAILALSLRGRFRPSRTVAPGPVDADAETDRTVPLERERWIDDIRAGITFVRGAPLLPTLIAAGVLGNMSFLMYESTFVLFATDELGVSERGFGWLLAATGIGAVAGGAVADRVVSRLGRRTTMLVGAGGPVFATGSIALVPEVWVVAVMLTVQVVLGTLWTIVAISLRQQLTPNHLYGRVNSLFRFFAWGAMPVGALLGGLIAGTVGLRATYVASALVMFVAFVLIATRLRTSVIDAALAAARPT